MSLSALRKHGREVNFAQLGEAATVTPPYKAAISTTVIWMRNLEEEQPVGGARGRRESRRLIAIQRADVIEVPRGTLISAPDPEGGAAKEWQVDDLDSTHWGYFVAIVVPKTEVDIYG